MHPFGDLLAAFVAKIAELKWQRIRDRVKAGQEKARANGKRLGRPKLVFDRAKLARLHQ
jgi:DNA invertase Pin-like site-specific DNA recombinase